MGSMSNEWKTQFLAGFLAGRKMRRNDEEASTVLSPSALRLVLKYAQSLDGLDDYCVDGMWHGYNKPDWTNPVIMQFDAEEREDYELRMLEHQAGMDY